MTLSTYLKNMYTVGSAPVSYPWNPGFMSKSVPWNFTCLLRISPHKCWDRTSNQSRQLPFVFFLIHYSLIILSFNTMQLSYWHEASMNCIKM